MIFETLSQLKHRRLRDLLAVALVSKNFCGPALDVLWGVQDSLPLLIKTFPPDLWAEDDNSKKLIFLRTPTQSDLDRYLFYSRKMRKLRFQGHNTPVDCSVLHMISIFLAHFFPKRFAMPHLREFKCEVIEPYTLWEIFPYLSVNLQRVEMEILHSRSCLPILTFLSALAINSPFVTRIILGGPYEFGTNATPVLSTFPCGFLHLSTFHCRNFPINRSAIVYLAHLPNLGDVSLNFYGPEASQTALPALPIQPFPSFRELELSGPRYTSGIEFIQTFLSSASLDSISFWAEYPPSAGEIRLLFLTLSSRISLSALTTVELENGDGYEGGPALEFDDFQPLLRFHNLECLRVNIIFPPERISDSLLETMSFAWPHLTDLKFDLNLPPSQCTFQGLLHLAKRCRRLVTLRIPFMASSKINRNGGLPVNASLEELDVGRSLIDDVGMVVSLLTNVSRVLIISGDGCRNNGDGQEQNCHRWKKVIEQYMVVRDATC